MHSMERVQQYLNIEQEPKATKDGIPPAYWPASGDLRVKNLSARYSTVCLGLGVWQTCAYQYCHIGWPEGSPRSDIPHQVW